MAQNEFKRQIQLARIEEAKQVELLGDKHPTVTKIRKQIEMLEKLDKDEDRRDAPAGGGARTTPVPIRPSDRSADDRVQSLEKQLEMLRRELEAMRRDIRREPGERRPAERRSEDPPARP